MGATCPSGKFARKISSTTPIKDLGSSTRLSSTPPPPLSRPPPAPFFTGPRTAGRPVPYPMNCATAWSTSGPSRYTAGSFPHCQGGVVHRDGIKIFEVAWGELLGPPEHLARVPHSAAGLGALCPALQGRVDAPGLIVALLTGEEL
ncbi:hypothetical protein VSDG_04643 [Cytospora chrysosperma]|uniref:Uncharacterized protein n=1 Tax=Cytospora chrysosperma TaxID=252740 RepID=A0A423W2U8_CYTCH|nr:hypothetical protein VSDG_04643 [Valsa sordida]